MESLLQKMDRAGLEMLCQRLTAKKPRGGNGVEGRYKRLILECLELYEVKDPGPDDDASESDFDSDSSDDGDDDNDDDDHDNGDDG